MKQSFSYISYIVSKSKRLLPSFLVVLFLCKKYISDEDEIFYSLLFMTNYYYYIKNTNYFFQYDSPSPILHYWCITLEYQLYFLIPFLLVKFYPTIVISMCILVSIFIYIKYININISYCYYCLLPRLYQLLAGSFIKVTNNESDNCSILILFTFMQIALLFWYSYNWIKYSLIYTIYVSLFIHFHLLNFKRLYTLIYFSNISYSIYLVHYPLISIFHISVFKKLIYILILSIVLYFLCEVYINKIVNTIPNLIFILSYLIIIITTYSVKILRNNEVILYNKKILWNDFCKYRHPCDINSYYYYCNKILLMGDSHIDQWVNAIYRYYSRKNVLIYYIWINGITDIPNMKIDLIVSAVSEIKNIEAIIMCNFKYNKEFRNDYKTINNFDRFYLILQRK